MSLHNAFYRVIINCNIPVPSTASPKIPKSTSFMVGSFMGDEIFYNMSAKKRNFTIHGYIYYPNLKKKNFCKNMIIKWFYPPSWSRSSRKIHEHVVCTRKTKITSSGMLDILFELLSGDRLPFHLISWNLNVLSFMTCGLLPFESAQCLRNFEKKMIKP